MTLILCFGNRKRVALVSDRRLTRNGRLVDNESNKATIFRCEDALVAFAFTGLARMGKTEIHEWLARSLFSLGKIEYLIEQTIERLREKATRDLAGVPARDRRLTVVFGGFRFPPRSRPLEPGLSYQKITLGQPETGRRALEKRIGEQQTEEGTLAQSSRPSTEPGSGLGEDSRKGPPGSSVEPGYPLWGRLSNFDGPSLAYPPRSEAEATFTVVYGPSDGDGVFVLPAGTTNVLTEEQISELLTLVHENKPRQAWVNEGVHLIRAAADSPQARNQIGKQCTSTTLAATQGFVLNEYHSETQGETIYSPNEVVAVPGRERLLIHPAYRLEGTRANGTTGPFTVTTVIKSGRNKPCPCGSGKKYKMCHGRLK